MSISSDLVALLANATAAGPRVYPLTAPDQVARPYIIYQRVFADTENVLSGNAFLTNTRMQIDVYANTYAEALSIFAQVDALMAGFKQTTSLSNQDLYEDQVKLFRILSDYSIWH